MRNEKLLPWHQDFRKRMTFTARQPIKETEGNSVEISSKGKYCEFGSRTLTWRLAQKQLCSLCLHQEKLKNRPGLHLWTGLHNDDIILRVFQFQMNIYQIAIWD
ncbi:uncharacterized protein LOC143686146 isoform X1 [Tamandua tetradactyla]|uniref:uncharacterized protein LOC143686146 isoform X1 n=1 Tax=Tamandua tetradactyla TaxID=48850 RepID=UPI0040547FC0